MGCRHEARHARLRHRAGRRHHPIAWHRTRRHPHHGSGAATTATAAVARGRRSAAARRAFTAAGVARAVAQPGHQGRTLARVGATGGYHETKGQGDRKRARTGHGWFLALERTRRGGFAIGIGIGNRPDHSSGPRLSEKSCARNRGRANRQGKKKAPRVVTRGAGRFLRILLRWAPFAACGLADCKPQAANGEVSASLSLPSSRGPWIPA